MSEPMMVKPILFRRAQERLEDAFGCDVLLSIQRVDNPLAAQLLGLGRKDAWRALVSLDDGGNWAVVCRARTRAELLRELEHATYRMDATKAAQH